METYFYANKEENIIKGELFGWKGEKSSCKKI